MTTHHSRVDFLDLARGIGILLVVFGHSALVRNDYRNVYDAIFSFHMPLFFLMSGIFFKPTGTFGALLVSRADRLLKPYAVTLLIFAPFKIAESNWTPATYLVATLFGSGLMLPVTPLWFLPHLYLLSLLAWLLLRNGYLLRAHLWIQYLTLALMLMLGVMLMRVFSVLNLTDLTFGAIRGALGDRKPGLPFSADLILVTFPFFIGGLVSREMLVNWSRSTSLTIGAALIFLMIHTLFDPTMDLNFRRYDDLLLSTVTAISGTLMVIGLSGMRWLSAIAGRPLRYLGENSLIIMCFHQPLLFSLGIPIAKSTGWSEPVVDIATLILTISICVVICEIINRTSLKYLYGPFRRKQNNVDAEREVSRS